MKYSSFMLNSYLLLISWGVHYVTLVLCFCQWEKFISRSILSVFCIWGKASIRSLQRLPSPSGKNFIFLNCCTLHKSFCFASAMGFNISYRDFDLITKSHGKIGLVDSSKNIKTQLSSTQFFGNNWYLLLPNQNYWFSLSWISWKYDEEVLEVNTIELWSSCSLKSNALSGNRGYHVCCLSVASRLNLGNEIYSKLPNHVCCSVFLWN